MALECLNSFDGGCKGPVEFQMSISPPGRSFPRCQRHWGEALDRFEENQRKYPMIQPYDFDPGFAGESWD